MESIVSISVLESEISSYKSAIAVFKEFLTKIEADFATCAERGEIFLELAPTVDRFIADWRKLTASLFRISQSQLRLSRGLFENIASLKRDYLLTFKWHLRIVGNLLSASLVEETFRVFPEVNTGYRAEFF